MQQVQGPASVLVTTLGHHLDCLSDAAVRFVTGTAEIVESAQDIVVPERREREAEPAFVDDFTGAERAEQAALQEIVFSLLAGLGESCRFTARAFVGEESFQHADGGMEGGAAALGSFAVPAAIFELLAQELIGESVVGFFEVGAQGEDSTVDAGLGLAVKEAVVAVPLEDEVPVDAVDHFLSLPAGGVEAEIH